MRMLRSHRDKLIERLKDPEFASAYLKACLDEYFETNDIGIFQLAIRYVVEAHLSENGSGSVSVTVTVSVTHGLLDKVVTIPYIFLGGTPDFCQNLNNSQSPKRTH